MTNTERKKQNQTGGNQSCDETAAIIKHTELHKTIKTEKLTICN
jgi:hypothetical protein